MRDVKVIHMMCDRKKRKLSSSSSESFMFCCTSLTPRKTYKFGTIAILPLITIISIMDIATSDHSIQCDMFSQHLFRYSTTSCNSNRFSVVYPICVFFYDQRCGVIDRAKPILVKLVVNEGCPIFSLFTHFCINMYIYI